MIDSCCSKIIENELCAVCGKSSPEKSKEKQTEGFFHLPRSFFFNGCVKSNKLKCDLIESRIQPKVT